MTQSIQERFSIDSIQYHTAGFSNLKQSVLIGAGFLSLTLLAVGILNNLHASDILNCGAIGSIPLFIGSGMVVIGGLGLSLATLYFFKARAAHQKIKTEMEAFLEASSKTYRFVYLLQSTKASPDKPQVHEPGESGDFQWILHVKENKKTMHVFKNKEEFLDFYIALKNAGSVAAF